MKHEREQRTTINRKFDMCHVIVINMCKMVETGNDATFGNVVK